MPTLAPDFLTALGMTSLAAWVMAWIVRTLGREYWQQGLPQVVWSSIIYGLSYLLLAVFSRTANAMLLLASLMLFTLAAASFLIGLQRFRQSDHWPRDGLTMLLPQALTMTLAALYLPSHVTRFLEWYALISTCLLAATLALLLRVRNYTPGNGWALLCIGVALNLASQLPLVAGDGVTAALHASTTAASTPLGLWGVCVAQFVCQMFTSMGYLLMLRDRQSALDQDNAWLDPLTQLLNRAAMVRGLEQALAQAERHGDVLSLMVLDIDHFKRVNDNHGHLVGDRVIQSVAQTLHQLLRSGDLAARYGGEEFVLVLPHTRAAEALPLAQRLCDAVRQRPLTLAHGAQLGVTISVGVCTTLSGQPCPPWEALLAEADAAMYQAKRSGRDRVVAAEAVPSAFTASRACLQRHAPF